MKSRLGYARVVALAATGLGGLVAGHLLDYFLVIPDPAHRHEFLARTGHEYFTRLTMVAVGAACVAAFVALALGFLRGRHGQGRAFSARAIAGVAVAQATGFLVLETTERLASGVPLHHLTDFVVLAGIGLQLVVGALAAIIELLLERAGHRIGAATKRKRAVPRMDRESVHRPGTVFARALWLVAPQPIRGPPLHLRA